MSWTNWFKKTQDDYTLTNGDAKMAEYDDLISGDGETVAVSRARPGYQTWPDDPITFWLDGWLQEKQKFQDFLHECGIHTQIDEVALMFEDEEQKVGFIRDAVRNPKVKLFNSAWDRVKTHPIKGEYFVEYDFMEVEGLGMRIEAMRIDRGFSPLHESLLGWRKPGNDIMPVTVHYSFKCSARDYEKVRAAMVGGGAWLVQACESTYGSFAYYGITPDATTYLKPRINKRDPSPAEADTPLTATELPNTDFGHPGVGVGYGAADLGLDPVPERRPIKDTPQA